MREIKFRAWDKKNESMFPDYRTAGHKTLNDIFWEADDFVFMQFTGLKDKNRVEIYEGDILETPYDTFAVDDVLPLRKDFWHKDDSDWWSYPEEVEIIGNIYENPVLLT